MTKNKICNREYKAVEGKTCRIKPYSKTHIKKLYLILALTALGWLLTGSSSAQTFTNLFGFPGGNDGAIPSAGVIVSGNVLYGTAFDDGSNRSGTVFSVQTDGSNFALLHTFVFDDGAFPSCGLILSSNTLYGTTLNGGTNNFGGVFSISNNGTAFANLHSFNNSDGANPNAGVILSGNTLYGLTQAGGTNGGGTVFSLNTDGSGFTNLYAFSAVHTNSAGVYTNEDGAFPWGALFLSGNTLYGTAQNGGTNGNGTIFAINTDGSGFTNLYTFSAGVLNDVGNATNSDGTFPSSGVILAGTTLYGTARFGGTGGNGTIFAFDTQGTGFKTLYSFTEGVLTNFQGVVGYVVNGDGANPGALILSSNRLYGTAMNGGINGNGTVFAINANGTNFVNLYTFSASASHFAGLIANSDGADPSGALALSGSTFYGTAEEGGTNNSGTVFSLTLTSTPSVPPLLTIQPSPPNNVVLAWPTNVIGFTLQFTPDLGSPAWTNVSSAPVIIDTNNTVISPITGTQMFFRLSQ